MNLSAYKISFSCIPGLLLYSMVDAHMGIGEDGSNFRHIKDTHSIVLQGIWLTMESIRYH